MKPISKLVCSLTLLFFPLWTYSHNDNAHTLSVLSYNVKCMAWPIGCNAGKMKKIGDLLAERRAQGTAPDLVLIQEGFLEKVNEVFQRSGYKHIIAGPAIDTKAPEDTEIPEKVVSSGLWILTDLPVENIQLQAFRAMSCNGWDCFANKGVLYVQVDLPGKNQKLAVLTTHMNAGSDPEDSAARGEQLQQIEGFYNQHVAQDMPVIFAGDFNLRPSREHFSSIAEKFKLQNYGQLCLQQKSSCRIDTQTDESQIFEDTVDHHYAGIKGRGPVMTPVYAARNFTELLDGEPLSDHLGYEVHYELRW